MEEEGVARLLILLAAAEYDNNSDDDGNSEKDKDKDDLRGSIRSPEYGRTLSARMGFYY